MRRGESSTPLIIPRLAKKQTLARKIKRKKTEGSLRQIVVSRCVCDRRVTFVCMSFRIADRQMAYALSIALGFKTDSHTNRVSDPHYSRAATRVGFRASALVRTINCAKCRSVGFCGRWQETERSDNDRRRRRQWRGSPWSTRNKEETRLCVSFCPCAVTLNRHLQPRMNGSLERAREKKIQRTRWARARLLKKIRPRKTKYSAFLYITNISQKGVEEDHCVSMRRENDRESTPELRWKSRYEYLYASAEATGCLTSAWVFFSSPDSHSVIVFFSLLFVCCSAWRYPRRRIFVSGCASDGGRKEATSAHKEILQLAKQRVSLRTRYVPLSLCLASLSLFLCRHAFCLMSVCFCYPYISTNKYIHNADWRVLYPRGR